MKPHLFLPPLLLIRGEGRYFCLGADCCKPGGKVRRRAAAEGTISSINFHRSLCKTREVYKGFKGNEIKKKALPRLTHFFIQEKRDSSVQLTVACWVKKKPQPSQTQEMAFVGMLVTGGWLSMPPETPQKGFACKISSDSRDSVSFKLQLYWNNVS